GGEPGIVRIPFDHCPPLIGLLVGQPQPPVRVGPRLGLGGLHRRPERPAARVAAAYHYLDRGRISRLRQRGQHRLPQLRVGRHRVGAGRRVDRLGGNRLDRLSGRTGYRRSDPESNREHTGQPSHTPESWHRSGEMRYFSEKSPDAVGQASRSARSTTLASSIARVIGPTPPGTGARYPATSATAGSTSPANLARPDGVVPTRFTPTSTTAAPGRTMSGVSRCGTPAATTTMSARRVWVARSRVPVWHRVTVAFSLRRVNSSPRGRPTVTPRPITTTSAPASGTPYRR